MDDTHARELVAKVDALLEEVQESGDAASRDRTMELVGALVDLYGEGLARLVPRVADPPALADDEVVSHLLLIHDIHPAPVEARVRAALGEVRPYLDSHGGNVELAGIEDGVVHLRMEGSCSGCPSSAMTLKLAIEDAIRKHAPEVSRIEAEDAVPAAAPGPALIQLTPMAPGAANGGGWTTAGSLPQLRANGTLLKDVAGKSVLFMRVDGSFYAYRPECPGCGRSLAEAELVAAHLRCAGCGCSFSVVRAGRCDDDPGLSLDPVPLLEDDTGMVKVALA